MESRSRIQIERTLSLEMKFNQKKQLNHAMYSHKVSEVKS